MEPGNKKYANAQTGPKKGAEGFLVWGGEKKSAGKGLRVIFAKKGDAKSWRTSRLR